MQTPIATIRHNDIKTFVQVSFEKNGKFKTTYLTLATLSSTFFAALCTYETIMLTRGGQPGNIFQILFGIAFSFSILVIIHELLHGIAYKLHGAKKVYYGGNIRKFQFYAASHLEVFNAHQFKRIALAPFITVSVLCVALIIIFPSYIPFLLTVLCVHSIFCGGDFMFLHFMDQYDADKLHTYDDRDKAESYFYYVD